MINLLFFVCRELVIPFHRWLAGMLPTQQQCYSPVWTCWNTWSKIWLSIKPFQTGVRARVHTHTHTHTHTYLFFTSILWFIAGDPSAQGITSHQTGGIGHEWWSVYCICNNHSILVWFSLGVFAKKIRNAVEKTVQEGKVLVNLRWEPVLLVTDCWTFLFFCSSDPDNGHGWQLWYIRLCPGSYPKHVPRTCVGQACFHSRTLNSNLFNMLFSSCKQRDQQWLYYFHKEWRLMFHSAVLHNAFPHTVGIFWFCGFQKMYMERFI